MRKLLLVILLCLIALPGLSQEKQSSDNPFSAINKRGYERTKGILLRSAEKMPEENYNFKPVDTVRTYGQIIGHLADAQYLFCSTASGEKNPGLNIEKTKSSKADLVAALKDGFAYCDKVYDSVTDAAATQPVKFFGNDLPKFAVLSINIGHNMEHYGNLVTYMRIKGIVPPTSEQQGAMPAQKQDKSDTQPKK
ncbi:MAG TPA: DinB family protein [Terriglobales bacterium]|nr:DinB family protein [Terriglobales bacterium]